MSGFAKLRKMAQSYPILRRNRKHPFEFGDVRPEDRAMAEARLQKRKVPQGDLLTEHSVLNTSFTLEGGRPPGLASARMAFRIVQRLFESRAVESGLKPWKVLGFMSNSMVPNGLAGVLHDADENVHFVNVTAGAYFHALFSAFQLAADSRFEPGLPNGGRYMAASAKEFFPNEIHVPLGADRRQLAARVAICALYATFFHELAHVLRGHTLFNKRRAAVTEAAILEVPDSPDFVIDPLMRAIELDADDFAGRFMAKVLLQGFSGNAITLRNPQFRNLAFEILVGVTLMYSWFAECEGYHSGSLRAYLVIGSFLSELKIDVKESAPWTRQQIGEIQLLMAELCLLPRHATEIREGDLNDMLGRTMALRESRQHDWLAHRPW